MALAMARVMAWAMGCAAAAAATMRLARCSRRACTCMASCMSHFAHLGETSGLGEGEGLATGSLHRHGQSARASAEVAHDSLVHTPPPLLAQPRLSPAGHKTGAGRGAAQSPYAIWQPVPQWSPLKPQMPLDEQHWPACVKGAAQAREWVSCARQQCRLAAQVGRPACTHQTHARTATHLRGSRRCR